MSEKTIPDPEVPEKARRRHFSARYKQSILEKADRCSEPGEVGELLRSEGLYSSHLSNWRQQREEGVLKALGKKRGRKPKAADPSAKKLARLERENQRLRRKLQQAETIIAVQKKLSEVLGIELPENDPNGRSE